MFKPLLRTIPTLSGNISLNCIVDEPFKTSTDTFATYIRHAVTLPVQNKLYDNIYNVSLIDGSWEYDVSKFYYNYKNYFYESTFSYNQKDYQRFDATSTYTQDSCDKDFQFGVKRQSYQKTGYQFNFYAPIYCDCVSSLPDAFEISIKFTDNLTKTIRIYINENHDKTTNYLYSYLKRYIDKIDDNVVYLLHESNQGMYYGIDVDRGGLVQLRDNVIGQLYYRQSTINNFDNIICEGFKRNNIIMRQIIPLSYSFNIDDILTKNEQKQLHFTDKITITGHYVTNGVADDFYDFSLDYMCFHPTVTKYDSKRRHMTTVDAPVNVMDTQYPSLNEAYYYKYKTTNKLSKRYNRWKLKYSPDENPYITNMSFAFSYCNSSNYNYGEFPIIENSNKPLADINVDDLQYDASGDKFTRFMNNHVSSWYTISDDPMSLADNKDAFAQVSNNMVYYKGILYSLKDLYDVYTDIDKIDKFGVFVNPKITVNSNLSNETLKYVKYVIDRNVDGTANADLAATITHDQSFGYSAMFINAHRYDANIYNNEFFTYNSYGTGDYVAVEEFDKYNHYYRKSDISSLFGSARTDYIFNKISSEYSETIFDENYAMVPIGASANIIEDNMNIITNGDDMTPLNDKVYVSPSTTSSKYKYDGVNSELQSFFIKDDFITSYEFTRYTYAYYPELLSEIPKLAYWNYIVQDIDDIIIDNTESTMLNTDFFRQELPQSLTYVYVDEYNLEQRIGDMSSYSYMTSYCKVVGIDMLKAWFMQTSGMSLYEYDKNHFITSPDMNDDINDISKMLYVRTRHIACDGSGLVIKDTYCTLYDTLKSLSIINEHTRKQRFEEFLCNVTFNDETRLFSYMGYNFDLAIHKKFYLLTPELLQISNIYDEYKGNDYETLYPLLMCKHDTDIYAFHNSFKHTSLKDLENMDTYEYYEGLIPINKTPYRYDIDECRRIISMFKSNIISCKDNIYCYSIYDEMYFMHKDIVSDFIVSKSKTYDINESISTSIDDSQHHNGITISKKNNVVYGYYMINETFDNTINSFNTHTNNVVSKYFETINGVSIHDSEYVQAHFNEINAVLDKSLFDTFSNNENVKNIMIKPSQFTIALYYRQYMIDDGNNKDSYKYASFFNSSSKSHNIYSIQFFNNDHPTKIKLNRYMNSITPYLYKCDKMNNVYYLKYKNTDKTINDDNIYSMDNVSIYKTPSLYVIDDYDSAYHIETKHDGDVQFYENKHFNASTVYNLLPSLEISLNEKLTYEDVVENETFDKTYKIFKKYLNINTKINTDDDSLILFLYNKYTVTYLSDPVKTKRGKKIYKLSYKFTLI